MGGGPQNHPALRETVFSGRYKAQGRIAALHLLDTSGGMPLSETMGLEIVWQGGSEKLKPECRHLGKRLPWSGVPLQASLHGTHFQSVYTGACRGGRCSVRRLPTDMPKLKVFPGEKWLPRSLLLAGRQRVKVSQPGFPPVSDTGLR